VTSRARSERVSDRLPAESTDVGAGFDPLEIVERAGERRPLFYMERPDAGESMVAVGDVATIRTNGASRFRRADSDASALLDALDVGATESLHVAPRLVGGFGFADECTSTMWHDFSPCLFVLPSQQWITQAGRTVSIRIGEQGARASGADPASAAHGIDTRVPVGVVDGVEDEDSMHWLARAREAIDRIEAGVLDKIVLARRESHALRRDLDVLGVLERLRATRPSCYTFCFAVGESLFFGSSPEKLLGVRNGRIEADALAGTAARGRTLRQDGACRDQLLDSGKDRREHAAVVDGIREALAPCVSNLRVAGSPEVRAYPEGFHLCTRVDATLQPQVSVFDVVAALHPTPAVCGVPRPRAREWLDRVEPDRGWYTGGIGWLDATGDALFAVALRAGLLARGRFASWAGAGIVAGSDAERELAETDLKMRALLDVVSEVAGNR
jgi:isochorismate synthase